MYKLNEKLLKKWRDSMSSNETFMLLMESTGLGPGTIQKLFAGTYASDVKPPLRKAIADVMGYPEDKLWLQKEPK